MRLLSDALLDGCFLLDLDERELNDVLTRVIDFLVARGTILPADRDNIESELTEHERQESSVVGHSVALPHLYSDGIKDPAVVFVRLAHPINLGAPDGIPTRYVIALLGPPSAAAQHVDTLAGIARLMSDEEFRYEAGEAATQIDLIEALERFRQRTAADRPKKERPSDGLEHSGRLFGGIIADFKRRIPHYVSDFTDGFHAKSVASILFLFFACLAPAITFGGIMSEKTGGQIGAAEMLIGSAICGVIYALFSGQPLIILGGTGPLLVFTALLYTLCGKLGLQPFFLETFALVGLWTALILIILAITDASCWMKYFTRFTDEIFAGLISIIFIFKGIESLLHIVSDAYKAENASHDAALVPLLLGGGTFYIAMQLSGFRSSPYLYRAVREFLADFGPAIALVIMAIVSITWFSDVPTKALDAPDKIQPSVERSWLINPFRAPVWVWFAAIVPALLATVLVYVDQNITARLVNSRDHKLHKGAAYHYDVGLMGILIAFCSIFGFPWLVAATVRSLNHIRSLATVETVVSREGDSRQKVLHVRENRLTGFTIHFLLGLSILALPLLKQIPMAVLYGLFLFMGVVSMKGNQMFERLRLWLMDSSLYPATHYTRRVPRGTIHKFTAIQVGCLVVLGIVEETPLGILFPLFLALLVPVRLFIGRFFTEEQLEALDSEEEPEEEDEHWT